jgi:hypothetical protein
LQKDNVLRQRRGQRLCPSPCIAPPSLGEHLRRTANRAELLEPSDRLQFSLATLSAFAASFSIQCSAPVSRQSILCRSSGVLRPFQFLLCMHDQPGEIEDIYLRCRGRVDITPVQERPTLSQSDPKLLTRFTSLSNRRCQILSAHGPCLTQRTTVSRTLTTVCPTKSTYIICSDRAVSRQSVPATRTLRPAGVLRPGS